MTSKYTTILDSLCAITKVGYGKELPGEFDFKFIELAKYYAAAGVGERAAVREYVTDDVRLLILGFGDRLATVAARFHDRQLVLFALLAHSIEDFRYDPRENIRRLALINHVAMKLGEDPDELFETVGLLSSKNTALALRDFNCRPTEMKSLRAMQIAEDDSSGMVRYNYL